MRRSQPAASRDTLTNVTPNDPSNPSHPPRSANPVLVRTRSLLEQVGSPFAALRTAREAAGLSLSDLSERLAVRPAFLEAVETGNLAVLPGSGYAGSLINMYAIHLGLDGESLVEAAFPAATPDTVSPAPGAAPAVPGPRRIISGVRLLTRRPSFTPGAPPPALAGGGAVGVRGVSPEVVEVAPVAIAAPAVAGPALPDTFVPPLPPPAPVGTVDGPYPGDPVPAEDPRGGRVVEVPPKPTQWVPASSTLAVPQPPSVTAVPAVKALRWVALVLFVAAILAALVLIVIMLVRSFEPQTALGMLLPWLPLRS